MSDATLVTAARPALRIACGQMVRVAVLLFVMVTVASYIFRFFYGLLARGAVEAMLVEAHFSDVLAIENNLLGLTMAPAVYGVLAAISPLIGWWIHARVEKPAQSLVGWGATTLFAVVYVAIGLISAGVIGRLAEPMILVWTLIGLALIVVYTVFFMGIGYNIAKLFRLSL